LIDKSVDHIIIALGAVMWFVLSLKRKPRLVMFAVLVTLAVISAFASPHNLSSIFLSLTALLSILAIIGVLLYDKFSTTKILEVHPNLSLNYLAMIGIAAGIITTIITSLHLLSIPISSPRNTRDYAFEIFVLINSVSPVLMILLILCFPVKLV
jgi:hypothetical protein